MKPIHLILLTVIFLFLSCQNETIDLEKEKEDIKKTDLAFSDLSEKEGMKKAFLTYADEEAVLLRPNSFPIEGKEEIGKMFTNFSDTGFVLSWKPLKAFISASADLGYTYGTFTSSVKNDTSVNTGTYISIWKKQPDGSWKWVLDTGNEGLGE
jgi:ketosteroid isomerase-like protein